MQHQYIRNIIEEICSSESLDNGNFIDGNYCSNSGQVIPIPKCITESFEELYSILKNELIKLANKSSSENLTKENVSSKLLSFLNENYKMALKERFSMENEKMDKKNKENYSIDNQLENPSDYEDSDVLAEENIHPNTSVNKKKTKQFYYQPKLEMQFVEQISVAPNIVVNLPSSSSNERNIAIKNGISNSADIDVNDDQSEVEVISAAKSLIESKQNSTNSNSLSFLTTSTSIVQPSTSEMSSGMIDENEAILLLAKYGNRICMYNVDTYGTIVQSKQAELSKKNGNPLALFNEDCPAPSNYNFSPSKITTEFEANSSKQQNNLVEIVPGTSKSGAIVAREISFQSSFDTALLMKGRKDDKEAINSTKKLAQKAERSLEKESSISMDEETLNQITPIPTTLELSS